MSIPTINNDKRLLNRLSSVYVSHLEPERVTELVEILDWIDCKLSNTIPTNNKDLHSFWNNAAEADVDYIILFLQYTKEKFSESQFEGV